MRSAIALSEAARGRRLRQASSSRSRTTSDSEIFRLRDSSAMPATNGSGNRTVRVFMRRLYYIASRSAGQTDDQLTHEGSLRLSASSAFQAAPTKIMTAESSIQMIKPMTAASPP